MSSGFVTGGSLDKPTERDAEWLRAEQELEEQRKRKAALEAQNGGKSLFEVLEANKAAKQEAFEEANKLKNQFRSLDDDEIDFLDSVLQAERVKEEAVKKETTEQLASFRKLQEDAERSTKIEDTPAAAVVENPDWAVASRKRKKNEKDGFKGLKLRKTSSSGAPSATPAKNSKELKTEAIPKKPTVFPNTTKAEAAAKPKTGKVAPASRAPAIGLVAYDSDDEEDED
ncbi:NEFA-interacting nuclear protein NIP30 [Microthyrium microscopicum]|uniref:NEFA-interacting nuclear protein NIP30 n=1 Tax=Microthyrium microscopicum TaxID=703497 RepID=A0A6A6U9N3_9PEZI|nr:NEFA-interacting nuclear protein NIP30 [Microthyrium microscopicum]